MSRHLSEFPKNTTSSYPKADIEDGQLVVVLMTLRVRRNIVQPHGTVPR